MTPIFQNYVRCFRQYFQIRGRASVGEFWSFALVTLSIFLVFVLIETLTKNEFYLALGGLQIMLSFFPLLTVSIRRLHDSNRSGWWFLIKLIPFLGGLYFLYLMVKSGDDEANRFGEVP